MNSVFSNSVGSWQLEAAGTSGSWQLAAGIQQAVGSQLEIWAGSWLPTSALVGLRLDLFRLASFREVRDARAAKGYVQCQGQLVLIGFVKYDRLQGAQLSAIWR